jgi:hypothetical protein
MPRYLFVWTPNNLSHLDENHVSADEFEEIVQNPDILDVSRTSHRPIALGTTLQGRRIACIYEMIDELTVLPITVYEIDA